MCRDRHHRLNRHEFEQTLGDGEGQGSLVCCSPWGSKESDTTEQLYNDKKGQARRLLPLGETAHANTRGMLRSFSEIATPGV